LVSGEWEREGESEEEERQPAAIICGERRVGGLGWGGGEGGCVFELEKSGRGKEGTWIRFCLERLKYTSRKWIRLHAKTELAVYILH
jgi:hypothetical protein